MLRRRLGRGRTFHPGEHSHMIWCIGNGRQRIGQFIDEAKHSLWVQNERYQDPVIIERLVRAKRARREGARAGAAAAQAEESKSWWKRLAACASWTTSASRCTS